MATKEISKHEDNNRKAVVYLDTKAECYSVDFYENDSIIATEEYPNKSVHWAEDCAENWVLGIKRVVNGD
jgi:hypothetical protein